MPLLKIKIVATQEQLSKWNAPNLKTGDIKDAKPSGDDFGYLIKEAGVKQDFWYAVPKDFVEVVDNTSFEVVYANIFKAAKEIWYDNGMINRIEPESEKVALLITWLEKQDKAVLGGFESELSYLSKEDFETVCCGEESEQERLASVPLNDFLNRIFDEEYEVSNQLKSV